jgi:hypothetical protein
MCPAPPGISLAPIALARTDDFATLAAGKTDDADDRDPLSRYPTARPTTRQIAAFR